MRGTIALVVFFVAMAVVTAADNYTVKALASFAFLLSLLYAFGLVFVFLFQRMRGWSREKSMLKIEEKVVKTKTVTLYECGHCKAQYSNAQTCPNCGSPYRKTLVEKTEEETVEKWKK